MSHKVLLGVFGGQTVDAQEERTGLIPQTMEDAAVIDTTVSSAVGHISIENETANTSGIAAVYMIAGAITIADLSGGAGVSIAKDTANSVNVYVEGGTIQVQNLTGGEASVKAQII